MTEDNKEKYLRTIVNPSNPVEGIRCPIDGSVLNCRIEYDFSDYKCESCGATYPFRGSQEEINQRAKRYLEEVKKQVEIKSLELGRLEKIVRTAMHNGI